MRRLSVLIIILFFGVSFSGFTTISGGKEKLKCPYLQKMYEGFTEDNSSSGIEQYMDKKEELCPYLKEYQGRNKAESDLMGEGCPYLNGKKSKKFEKEIEEMLKHFISRPVLKVIST